MLYDELVKSYSIGRKVKDMSILFAFICIFETVAAQRKVAPWKGMGK
jgi:hypothetical protein